MGARDLPLAILATGFDLTAGTSGEIAGFLYFSDDVPVAVEARKLFTWDLLTGKCCQISLRGSEAQVDALLRIAAVSSGWSFDNSHGIAECIAVAKENALPFGFDNLEEATGRGLPVRVPLWLVEDETEIAQRLENLGDELELTLDPTWMPQALFDE